MIFDVDKGERPSDTPGYDVCIAGGGVAGIVLAVTLAARRKSVLLLEGGGLDYSDDSQSLYGGTTTGAPYHDLEVSRLRYLGGTSNHWEGHCLPFDAIDFEPREAIPGSGWPIGIADIEPYQKAAQEILEISDFEPAPVAHKSDGRLKSVSLQFSRPVRFGEKYREFLTTADAAHLFVNANLVDIEFDPEQGRVSGFLFHSLKNTARPLRAVANHYVLALGGIENARMLLNSDRQMPQGLGNENDLVGRYFMDHINCGVGYYVTSKDLGSSDGTQWILPTAKVLRSEGIGAARSLFGQLRESDWPEFVNDSKAIAKGIVCANDVVVDYLRTIMSLQCSPSVPIGAGLVFSLSEQVPNPKSRVTLTEEQDRFGLRRVQLDWQLSSLDKKNLRLGALEIATFLARQDLGRVKLFDWLLDDTSLSDFSAQSGRILAGHHHIGTTRMGHSRQDGVVNRDCRLFDVENLYVAGSSTFRTSSHANPTLTIVQMALRLADHLAQK